MSETPNVGQFCWTELATPNVQAAKDFYGKLLGWKFEDHEMGDMTYTMISTGEGKGFGGMWQIPTDRANEIPPHWMGYILVENVEEKLKEAEKAGATVKMPVTKAGEYGLFAIIVDPTGAHVALWQTIQHK